MTASAGATVRRYGFATAAVLVALGVHHLLTPLSLGVPFLLFFPAVMVAAWAGGFGPGLVATVLSALAANYFFIEPLRGWVPASAAGYVKLALFFASGVLISALADALRRATARARHDALALRHLLEQRDLATGAADQSESQLRLVTDALPVLICYVDSDYRYRLANRTYTDWFGMRTDEVVGRRMAEVIGEQTFQLVKPHVDRALAGNASQFEGMAPYARGGRHISAEYVPDVAPGGTVRGVIVLVTDITARKRDELAARFLADAGSLLAGSLEYDQTLARVCKLAVPAIGDWCAVDMLGPDGTVKRLAVAHSDPAKEQLAWELWRKYPPQPGASAGLMGVLASGRAELTASITPDMIRRGVPDAEYARILLELGLRSAMIVPLIARGRTLGAITLVTAESGRAYGSADLQLAEELARRAAVAVDNARLFAEAQEASRAKDQFLATVSHELRTPLNAILGWAQLLSIGTLQGDEAKHGIGTIERNARAQAQLIEDLLDISRIITGKLRLDVRPTELCPVIEGAVDAVRHAAAARRIALNLALDCGAVPVNGDPARLQQVVWNLLSNAIKFTPEGGRVDVRLERQERFATVTVADNGPGIAPEFLPHVFDRFRQADGSSTRRHGGLGIGLSIVQHLVELHGGTVEARNDTGSTGGAIFIVRLPLAVPAAAAAVGDPTRAGHEKHEGADGSGNGQPSGLLEGVRVLVVDDEPDALDLVSRVLRRTRAEVTAVTSVAEALDAIRRSRPDVLLSDIGMPGEDGYDLIRQVRAAEAPADRPLAAAALTAFAREEDRHRALAAGFQRHVSKPVEPDELTRVVADLVGRQRDPA